MSFRSQSSLEKDEFNFAFILAHDLQKFAALECIELIPQERLSIISICIRLNYRSRANSQDLTEIESLLGINKTEQLKKNAVLKARLETDFVNSQLREE